MECDRIQDRLSGYLDGELPADEAGGIGAHLADCPACAAAAHGLKETLALLAALPRESAPPELIDGVFRKIEREKAESGSLRKMLFHPARVKIPIGSAAAVLLFLLAYGVQKEMPAERTPPPPTARVESTRPGPVGNETAARRGTAAPQAEADRKRGDIRPSPTVAAGPRPVEDPEPERKRATAAAGRAPRNTEREGAAKPGDARSPRARDASERNARERSMAMDDRAPREPAEKSAPLPAVPATLVSSDGRPVAPAPRRDAPAGFAAPGVFGAPPSRLLRPLPYGREVTIVVSSGERPGIEKRIAEAAARQGGIVVGDPRLKGRDAQAAEGHAPERDAAAGESRSPRSQETPDRPDTGIAGSADREARAAAPDPVRVHVPAASAEAFIDDLRTLGAVPPEGMSTRGDLPAGPSPGVVAYTVRIRVR